MRNRSYRQASAALILSAFMVGALALAGCSGSRTGSIFGTFGSPFRGTSSAASTATGPGSTGVTSGGTLGGGARSFTDPCTEPRNRKFVNISMRNTTRSYIHYFMAFVAFINSDEYPNGGVCPDDIALYTSFGYTRIETGQEFVFGNYCFTGPALIYFHENGRFQTVGGSGGGTTASAIAPASGSSSTYDNFFTSARARVPVPDRILFHNPGGTNAAQLLKISFNATNPCDEQAIVVGDPDCEQDAFYYVDQRDLPNGSLALLGPGSARRVSGDVQGTGCECLGFGAAGELAFQVLAPSNSNASGAECNEFLRGGSIDFVFVREDTDPPFPQLLWRVTDSSGAVAHEFDPAAGLTN
jgi:hypothetical protein